MKDLPIERPMSPDEVDTARRQEEWSYNRKVQRMLDIDVARTEAVETTDEKDALDWPMYFDRFDIVEAYALLAHDFGLYGVYDRITHGTIRATLRPSLSWETLSDNSKAIYANAVWRAERTGKHDRRVWLD